MLQFQMSDDASSIQGLAFLIYGNSGVGKTSLAATLDPSETLILSAESGLLSLRKYKIPVLVIRTLDDFTEALAEIKKPTSAWAKNVLVDSFTEVAEQCLASGKKLVKDARQAYSQLADSMIEYAKQFRDIPGKNKFLLAKEEFVRDENAGILMYGPMMPGNKVGPQLPYLFDEVFRLAIGVDPATKNQFRYIQTTPDVQVRAKDRSGCLDSFEPFQFDPVTKMPIPGTGLANILTKMSR